MGLSHSGIITSAAFFDAFECRLVLDEIGRLEKYDILMYNRFEDDCFLLLNLAHSAKAGQFLKDLRAQNVFEIKLEAVSIHSIDFLALQVHLSSEVIISTCPKSKQGCLYLATSSQPPAAARGAQRVACADVT